MENEKMPYKEITNSEHKYQVYPLTGRAACHLDRKVTEIAYSFKDVATSRQDMGMRIISAFAELDELAFDDLVERSIPNVIRLGNEGEQNKRLTLENIYDLFNGDIDGLYGLLLALWEAYELTPFKTAKAQNTGV